MLLHLPFKHAALRREFYFSATSDFFTGSPGQEGLDTLSEVLPQHIFNISIHQ